MVNDAMDLCFLAAEVNVVTVGGVGVRQEVVSEQLCCWYENNEQAESVVACWSIQAG